MKKIGFNINPETTDIAEVKAYVPVVEEPKLSVVTVRFEDGREYPYLNDKFNLKIGDMVFVDGKLKGRLGMVVAVTTKFKVSLAYYKYVLAKADFSFHGSFKPVANFVVSRGEETIPFEQLQTWLPPAAPDDEPEEFVCGEGYAVNLNDIESTEGFDYDTADAAVELLTEGYVKFISVVNGIGRAVIKRRHLQIVEFRLEGNNMTDIFCGCLNPGLCRHILAVAIGTKKIIDTLEIGEKESFTAIENDLFNIATNNRGTTIVV